MLCSSFKAWPQVVLMFQVAAILRVGRRGRPSSGEGKKWPLYCPQGSGTLRQQLLMMHGIALYCIVLHGIAWYCTILHHLAPSCTILHVEPCCTMLHHVAP